MGAIFCSRSRVYVWIVAVGLLSTSSPIRFRYYKLKLQIQRTVFCEQEGNIDKKECICYYVAYV